MIDDITVVRHIGKEIVFDLFNYELNSESEPSGSRTELHLNADRERVASWIARQTETLRTPKVKVRAMMHTRALAVFARRGRAPRHFNRGSVHHPKWLFDESGF